MFKNKMYNEIKYKIKELRNAALLALEFMKRAKQLGKDDENLLQRLVTASIFEGKELLTNNAESLHAIFSTIPNEEELMQVIKEIKGSEDSDNDDITDEDGDISENEENNEHSVQIADEKESVSDKDSTMSENEEMMEEPAILNDIDSTIDEKESLTDHKSNISEDDESIDMEEEVKTENEQDVDSPNKDLPEV